MMLGGSSSDPAFTKWEKYRFILCDHQGLRKVLRDDLVAQDEELSEDWVRGKYVSPADLRNSPGFERLITAVENKQQEFGEKAMQMMSPEERKAEEVAGRLKFFDGITQRNFGDMGRPRRQHDELHVVALDRVKGGAWFSIEELRLCLVHASMPEVLLLGDASAQAGFPGGMPLGGLIATREKTLLNDSWVNMMKERLA